MIDKPSVCILQADKLYHAFINPHTIDSYKTEMMLGGGGGLLTFMIFGDLFIWADCH
jgi:hypothetical protein